MNALSWHRLLLNDRTQESLTSIRMIKAFGLEDRQSALFAADAEDTGKKTCGHVLMLVSTRPSISRLVWRTCWRLAAVSGGTGQFNAGPARRFIMYLGLMIWSMLALAWMFNIVERGSAAYSRIHTVPSAVVIDGSDKVRR